MCACVRLDLGFSPPFACNRLCPLSLQGPHIEVSNAAGFAANGDFFYLYSSTTGKQLEVLTGSSRPDQLAGFQQAEYDNAALPTLTAVCRPYPLLACRPSLPTPLASYYTPTVPQRAVAAGGTHGSDAGPDAVSTN